jgi:mannose-1-phosphate guanylyltransferase/mannose-1-phosphate guanylyltransferase/mannose-6-phosphate isomerase
MRKVLPFILCGGEGTRLWPLSREAYPKQFHRLTGPETLFQQACRRLSGPLFGGLCVLSNYRHRFLVAEQLDEIDVATATILLEPVGRNTAFAACVAALIATEADADALVLLAPSDHMMPDQMAFTRAVETGLDFAVAGALVTFGVTPDCPHTGYDYIETETGKGAAIKVTRFVEKPSLAAAEAYLDSDRFYWNSGIFLFKAASMLDLFQVHAPNILKACEKSLSEAKEDLGFRVLGASYSEAPTISLDYAIAEKATDMVCVPLTTPWSDVGSWSALWNFMDKDARGNVACGEGEIILEGTEDSFAYSDHACLAQAMATTLLYTIIACKGPGDGTNASTVAIATR